MQTSQINMNKEAILEERIQKVRDKNWEKKQKIKEFRQSKERMLKEQ